MLGAVDRSMKLTRSAPELIVTMVPYARNVHVLMVEAETVATVIALDVPKVHDFLRVSVVVDAAPSNKREVPSLNEPVSWTDARAALP